MFLLLKLITSPKEFFYDLTQNNFQKIEGKIIETINAITPTLSQSPEEYSKNAWDVVSNISSNIVIVIAGLIFAYVMSLELIELITQKNNYHEVNMFEIYFWILKIGIGIFILQNYLTIVNSIFDVGNWAVTKLMVDININPSELKIISDTGGMAVEEYLETTSVEALMGDAFISFIAQSLMWIVTLLIHVIVIGRFFEIYLYSILGSIALATITSKEFRNIGLNFIKNILSLALQGVLIVSSLAIYAGISVSINESIVNGNGNILYVLAFSIVLCVTLFKTKTIAQSIFDAR